MRKKLAALLYALLLLAALCFIAVRCVRDQPTQTEDRARVIPTVLCETADSVSPLTLPARLNGLATRAPVTLTAELQVGPGEFLLVKSVFAPVRVYLNDVLAYQYGQPGSYPAYMNDPPTNMAFIPLPAGGGAVSLRMAYQAPSQRSALALPALSVGTAHALMLKQFKQDGFTFLFAFLLIFMGLVMLVVSLSFVSKIRSASSFLWLGLFSLSAGVWSLGECDLTALIFPYPSLLYAIAYLGLFLLTIPLLRFGLTVLQPRNMLPMQLLLGIHYAAVALTLLLQLTGRTDFTKSLYLFHLIAPLGFVTLVACLLWERFRYCNLAAGRFGIGIVLLALAVLLELFNYWLGFTDVLTLFFQIGVLAFVVSLGITSGYYMRDSLHTAAEKTRLEYEMAGIERQLALQRLQYQKLTENDELVKAQRHDLRHQLTVLRRLTADERKLNAYIDGLVAKIPSGEETRLCQNYAVNAVAAYYLGMAQQAGVAISLSLTVPGALNAAIESDLCVVVGNLMENAVEACQRMTGGRRFIHIGSSLQYDVLTITADNSFTGSIKKCHGAFMSSKRADNGIGISSIAAVARRHGGNARFEEKDGIFKASVYLQLE